LSFEGERPLYPYEEIRNQRPVIVVLQLSGGNEYMNTVVPLGDPHYYDNRPLLGLPEDDVLKLDGEVGLHPSMGPLKRIYEQGDLAIVHGVGWAGSNRSHFRCMDIWHRGPRHIRDGGLAWKGHTPARPPGREPSDRREHWIWTATGPGGGRPGWRSTATVTST
jgi:uncharacterized protein (DUF1501 family)